jgi:LPXTG-motif cell wall-anchored protein
LGTAIGGSFRIVGDPGGTITLAGPSAIPGTLRWNGTPLPPGSLGIGYFIDTATGGTVNLTASCTLQSIPSLSENMLMLLGGMLLLAGGAVVLARRR